MLDAGPARLKVSHRLAAGAAPPARPGLARGAGVDALRRPGDDRLGRARARRSSRADAGSDGRPGRGRRLPEPETGPRRRARGARYRGVRIGGSVLDVYAIPTTRGVLTLVCSARNGAPEAPTWCLNGLDQITVAGARPLRPAADTAYRMRAPAVLKELDAARVRERKALRRARGPVGQQRAARSSLRSAYRTAAEELAPLAPGKRAPARVVASLRETARAYRALGAPPRRRAAGAAGPRARTAVSARRAQTLKRAASPGAAA